MRQAAVADRSTAEDGRQQDQHEDGEQVLDDQPADGDVAGRRVQVVVVRRGRAIEHDGAGDRDGQAEDDAGRPAPAEGRGDAARRGRWRPRLWHDRPGHGHPADGQQLLEVELQADAEHQQDDADLGELLGQIAGRRRSPACVGPTTMPASR